MAQGVCAVLPLDVQLTAILRVLAGGAVGATLGWERERKERAAGLRTHMAVGMAAALIMSLGDMLVRLYSGVPSINADPVRVLEAVVGGVAFLGAGTIVVHQRTERVRGLTTAAGLLVTAALGIAVGVGAYLLTIVGTVMMLLVLLLSRAIGPTHDDEHETS